MLHKETHRPAPPAASSEAQADTREVALALGKLLADTHALYLKTHGYHWNVRGPEFPALHALFESQYRELWGALDEIAERIRALGALAPQGQTSMANLTGLKDGDVALGREAGDITFPGDGFVSGRHANFVFKGGRLSVKDLGSSNGTFFRLMQPTVLDTGDQLLIGRHLVKVERP